MKRKPGALSGSTALLQSDALVKQIYDTYYKEDAKAFLDVLEVIYEKGAEIVQSALKRLEIISPRDMGAEKVHILCENLEEQMTRGPGSDRLSTKSKSTLPQYDLLRKLQAAKEAAVS